ncbi:hypothetical protein J3459_016757 [Metarhizium acridum]|nr:hypothetical protein J3459_016757 [Metarhizium acridum]
MSRYYRESDSDDDRYKRTTVTRYKVGPERHGERFERTERIEVDDDRRSKFSARNSGDLLDARGPISPDRPRSAFEPYAGDRPRTAYYERDVERDSYREPDRSRITVYESKETDRDWDRRSHRGHNEEELKVEKRVEERFDDNHGHDVERYRKETEYYMPQSPPPPPVIIRQQSTEPQKIIVQDAPPAPIVVPRQQNPGVVVLRDREREDREMVRRDRDVYGDDYYYRHERRDVGPYRGDYYRNDRERDYAMARYDRRRRDADYYSDDDEFYYRRTVRRERSESPHHKRHLAEGALAGAGISALLTSRRDEYGDLPDNRGGKVLAGAALGALGTEVVRRAHSAYEDKYGDDRESPDHHHLLKKGLGVAAVALAAAGAAKYYQASKVDKEEAHRGRSRTRGGYYSGDDYSRSVSRASHRSKSRRRSISTAAKAAIGTAATAGIIKHFRDKSKSRSRHGSRSRSKSRLRRVAEIGGVAAAAGVANKLWQSHKEKKEHARDPSASSDDEYYRRRDSRSRHRSLSGSRHRSRSRSMARSPYSQPGADPELGLVEYGNDPLYPESRDALARRYVDSEAEDERRDRRRRRRRDRSASASASDNEHERKRSRSRLRDVAAAGAAAGAAAMGIKEFKDRKDRKDQEKRDRRSRERDDERRRRDEDQRRDYFDDHVRPHSPPTASGGAYYPPYPPTPNGPPMASGANRAPYPDQNGGAPLHREYQPYVPQDYTGYAPPPPPPPAGPPPPPEPGFRGAEYTPGPPPPPAGPPPTGGKHPPDHVSDQVRSQDSPARDAANDGVNRPYGSGLGSGPPAASKSVSFIPLSPKSSMTMERHRREHAEASEGEDSHRADEPSPRDRDDDDAHGRRRHRASNRARWSEPTPSRPLVRRSRRSRDESSGSDNSADDVEVLPDRFDSHGRPLDGRSSSQDRWTTRRGTFRREPQRPGGWDVQGAWQVSGTDQQAVDRLVKNVTSALEGQKGWMGIIGQVLGSGLLQGANELGSSRRRHDDGYDSEGDGWRRHGARR